MERDVQLLTVKEAGKRLRVSPATLFRLIRAGQLAPIKIGRRTLFAAEDVQTLVEKNRRGQRASLGPPPQDERERVLGALWEAGLLAEPTPEMRRQAEKYDARHSPAEQERILAELRSLCLKPSLSEIILHSREWRLGSEWVTKE